MSRIFSRLSWETLGVGMVSTVKTAQTTHLSGSVERRLTSLTGKKMIQTQNITVFICIDKKTSSGERGHVQLNTSRFAKKVCCAFFLVIGQSKNLHLLRDVDVSYSRENLTDTDETEIDITDLKISSQYLCFIRAIR